MPLLGSMLAVIITGRTFQHRTLLRFFHLQIRILPALSIQLAQSSSLASAFVDQQDLSDSRIAPYLEDATASHVEPCHDSP
jgi:hypothetical protein